MVQFYSTVDNLTGNEVGQDDWKGNLEFAYYTFNIRIQKGQFCDSNIPLEEHPMASKKRS